MNKIKGLNRSTSFEGSAYIILKFRYNTIGKKIKEYLKSSSIENLHTLRIAIRRLRYSMENFEICYKKKDFNRIIDYLRYLQGLIGEGRDLDVFEEKMQKLALENEINVPDFVYKIIEEKKEISMHNIKLELMKFLNDKNLRNFFLGKTQ